MLKQIEDDPAGSGALEKLQVLVTAEEVYPEMERAFLAAEREIWASYRIFDLSTKLRSEEGREVGVTWFDLIVHVLKRGVAIHMVLSDFDPIFAPVLHRASWRARRAFIAAAEVAGPDARLDVVNSTHAARVGLLPRIALWPRVWRQVARQARELNGLSAETRARRLEVSPGLCEWLNEKPGGTLAAKKWPPPPLIPGTHHQKIAVFDRELLCIGGLDLDERRYDDKEHRRRRDETWHDVQVMCRGKVVEEAQRHMESFLSSVAGTKEPPKTQRLLRTLSRRRRFDLAFLGPRPILSELSDAHHRMIGLARRQIYLESQYFRDRRVAEALAEAAEKIPDLSLILVLPGAPEDVAFEGKTSSDARYGEYLQAKCIEIVQNAFGSRASICSPVRPKRLSGRGRDTLCGAPIIYVHAKVSVFDDERSIVSSANLNGRSLLWDTEAGVALEDRDQTRSLRHRVMTHWLPSNAGDEFFDLSEGQAAWRVLCERNAAQDPEKRDGFLVPYDVCPARALGRPLPGVPEAMV